MEPIVTVESESDSIVFSGTNIAGAFIYDNDFLDSWLALSEVDVKLNKRPNAHGTYEPDRLYAKEKRIKFPGRYFSGSIEDATFARDRLSGLFMDGTPVTITVEDAAGTTSRRAFLVAFEPTWEPDGNFEFEAEFAAPDPRRYSETVTAATDLASPSTGLVWPLFAGGIWDWGTEGGTGRVSVENNGNATAYPLILVGDGGDMPDGFAITEVDTGRTLIYAHPTNGDVVRLDARTQRATINGGDVTDGLTRREWPSVPARSSRVYQFTALGSVTGTPTMQVAIASASL